MSEKTNYGSTSIYLLISFQTPRMRAMAKWLVNIFKYLTWMSNLFLCGHVVIRYWAVDALFSFWRWNITLSSSEFIDERVPRLGDAYALSKFETPLQLEDKFNWRNLVEAILVTLAALWGSSDWCQAEIYSPPRLPFHDDHSGYHDTRV